MFPVFILSCLSSWKGDFQTQESAKLHFFQKMPCSLHTSQTNMVQAANYTCVTTDKTGAKCSSSSFMSVHTVHPSIANQQATDEILHRVIPLQATSSKTPQSSIKSETFLVSPISIAFDFLSRQCERVTGRESVHTRLAWLRKKNQVCYCSYSAAKMNSLLTHLKSFHFYATVYSATQPRTYRQYLLSMKYFCNETLIFWTSSYAGKKYVWC